MDDPSIVEVLYRTSCGSSACPTTYRTSRGTMAVQGWTMPGNAGLDIPAGEAVVEIPPDVENAIGEQWARRQHLI